jgi:hypothetical protein
MKARILFVLALTATLCGCGGGDDVVVPNVESAPDRSATAAPLPNASTRPDREARRPDPDGQRPAQFSRPGLRAEHKSRVYFGEFALGQEQVLLQSSRGLFLCPRTSVSNSSHECSVLSPQLDNGDMWLGMPRGTEDKPDWILKVDPYGEASKCFVSAAGGKFSLDCRPLDRSSHLGEVQFVSGFLSAETLNGTTVCLSNQQNQRSAFCMEATRRAGAAVVRSSAQAVVEFMGPSKGSGARRCLFDASDRLSCQDLPFGNVERSAVLESFYVEQGDGAIGVFLRTASSLISCAPNEGKLACSSSGRAVSKFLTAQVALMPGQSFGESDRVFLHDGTGKRVVGYPVSLSSSEGGAARGLNCLAFGWANRDPEVVSRSSQVRPTSDCFYDPWGLGGPSLLWMSSQFWEAQAQRNMTLALTPEQIRNLLCNAMCQDRADNAMNVCYASAAIMCGAALWLGGVGCPAAFGTTLGACTAGIHFGKQLCVSDCLTRGGT